MTVTDFSRHELLERYGRWYGDEHFAVAFTASNQGENAKRVTTARWDQTKPLTSGDFGASFVAGRGATKNPAIVLRPSNLVVLECDTEDDLLRIQTLDLPVTITVRSSAPYKRHFWFRPPADVERLPAVAFRFESGKLTADSGRYFLAPPSIHPSGSVYAFLPDLGPDDVDLAELPEDVYRMLLESAAEETAEQRERIHVDPNAKVIAGQRGDSIFRYACMLRRWGLSHEAILDACLLWNDARCEPPIERHRVEMQVDGAFKKQGEQEIQRALQHPIPDEPEPQPHVEVNPGRWQRINLADPKYAIPPEPPSVHGLLYTGHRHVISGPPESTKTLISYLLLLEALRDGNPIAVLDFEMGAGRARRLMHEVGFTLEELASIFYVEPLHEPNSHDIEAVVAHGAKFVLLDAAAGAYDASGLDDNARKDAERFARAWIRPLWQQGVATIVVDHVTKNIDTRGKFTIGSERKVGQADVHLSLDAVKPLTRGGSGLVKAHVHKDRDGFLPRPTAVTIALRSDENHRITAVFEPPVPVEDDLEFRPTHQMERVSRYLEDQPEPVSRTQVETSVKGKSAKALRQALDALTHDGYIIETPGPRNARNVHSVRPYRQQTTTPSDPVPPRLDGVNLTPSAAVPPTGTRTGSTSSDDHDPVWEEPDAQDRAFLDQLRADQDTYPDDPDFPT